MEWLNLLPKKNWIAYLLSRPALSFANSKEQHTFLSESIDTIIELIESSKIGNAIDHITLGLYLDKVYFFDHLKRKGILRHSTYLNKRNPVVGIADYILKYREFFQLDDLEIDYFTSLQNLQSVYAELNKINSQINQELFKFKNLNTIIVEGKTFYLSKVKSLFAINEMNFLHPKTVEKIEEDLTSYDFYSKEEISEGVSLLAARYNQLIGFKYYDTGFADSNYATQNRAKELIVLACRFIKLKDLEIEVEVYSYCCVTENNRVMVFHKDTNFAKSIELSNIQYRLQNISNAYYSLSRNTQAASLEETSRVFHEKLPGLFELKTYPARRYVLAVPTLVYSKFLAHNEMSFFREELNIIRDISRELLIPFDNLENYELKPSFTLYDFYKLLRFFILQSSLYSTKMTDLVGKGKDELIYSSLIAVFKKNDLIDALELISEKEKVLTFLEMITWKSDEKKQYLDLQYTPLIRCNDYYLVPICLIGKSNLPRNIFLSERKAGNNIRGAQIDMHMPIADILSRAFQTQSFFTQKELAVKYKTEKQKESDIDFLAYKDGVLFIAECKDTILPTDLYEMRTTYDYVKKAVTQLTYISTAFSDTAYFDKFCKQNLGIHSTEVKKILYTIVLSNNKFYGYHFGQFAVRNVRELIAFVSVGNWSFSIYEEHVHKFNLWKGNEFHVNDLVTFCSEKSAHVAMFEACNERMYKYGGNIFRKSYSMNLLNMVKVLETQYSYVLETVSENAMDDD